MGRPRSRVTMGVEAIRMRVRTLVPWTVAVLAGLPAGASAAPWTLSLHIVHQVREPEVSIDLTADWSATFEADLHSGPVAFTAPFSAQGLDNVHGRTFTWTGTLNVIGAVTPDGTFTFTQSMPDYAMDGRPYPGAWLSTGLDMPFEDGASRDERVGTATNGMTMTWTLDGREDWDVLLTAREMSCMQLPRRACAGATVRWSMLTRVVREHGAYRAEGPAHYAVLDHAPRVRPPRAARVSGIVAAFRHAFVPVRVEDQGAHTVTLLPQADGFRLAYVVRPRGGPARPGAVWRRVPGSVAVRLRPPYRWLMRRDVLDASLPLAPAVKPLADPWTRDQGVREIVLRVTRVL